MPFFSLLPMKNLARVGVAWKLIIDFQSSLLACVNENILNLILACKSTRLSNSVVLYRKTT